MKKMLFTILLFTITGCGSNIRLYVHPDADFGYIKKVAVIPFVNLTNNQFASEKITECFITELLIAERFDVVEPGELSKVAKENGIIFASENKEIDSATAKKIGEKLEVEAIICGSVSQYEMMSISHDQYPTISINVRLIDTGTGKIAWMGSYSDQGSPSAFLIFTWGEINTLPEITQIACKKLVNAIIDKTYK